MKSPSEPTFTVIDRRGQNRSEEPVIIPEVLPETLDKEDVQRAWKEVAYILAIAQGGPGMLLMIGRAVGIRSDEKPFTVDYLLHPLVTDNTLDWRPHAKKRLDTFLNCECSLAHGACAVHKLYLPQWQQQDERRYGEMGNKPVPRPLEILAKAEVAKRQTNLMVPR